MCGVKRVVCSKERLVCSKESSVCSKERVECGNVSADSLLFKSVSESHVW